MYQSQFAKRYVVEEGQEAIIAQIIEPIIEDMGFQLVRVRISSRDGCTLQIMAERPDGQMTIDDCADVSKAISPVLDVEDNIPSAYHLEVSSPGIDRPLVRAEDFMDWLGYEAKVETRFTKNGRKRYRGRILLADETGFTLRLNEAIDGKNEMKFAYDDLGDGKLMITDDLISAALKKSKNMQAEINDEGEVSFIDEETDEVTGQDHLNS